MSDSFVTLWTIAHQALLSMRFPREEYWSGFHFLLQGIIHIQGPLQITKLFNILLISSLCWYFSFTGVPAVNMDRVRVPSRFGHVWHFVTSPRGPLARQTPLFMKFSQQEHWSRFPCPPPVDLPHLGMESLSLALAGIFFAMEPPGKPRTLTICRYHHLHFELRKWVWKCEYTNEQAVNLNPSLSSYYNVMLHLGSVDGGSINIHCYSSAYSIAASLLFQKFLNNF